MSCDCCNECQQKKVQLAHEESCVATACRWSLLLGAICWILAAKYLLFVAYLKPVSHDWSHALRWKPALVIGAVASVAERPSEPLDDNLRVMIAAGLAAYLAYLLP